MFKTAKRCDFRLCGQMVQTGKRCGLDSRQRGMFHGGPPEKIIFRSRKVKGTPCFRNFSIDNDLFTTVFTVQMGRCKILWGAYTPLKDSLPVFEVYTKVRVFPKSKCFMFPTMVNGTRLGVFTSRTHSHTPQVETHTARQHRTGQSWASASNNTKP